MATRRVGKERTVPLPPLLVRVIHAAGHAPHDPVDRIGHDAALLELGRWALIRVPTEGVLAPVNSDAYKAIQETATRHLAFGEARAAAREALSHVEPFGTRDEVESAYNRVQSVSDDAYYYAGLACGIALASLGSNR